VLDATPSDREFLIIGDEAVEYRGCAFNLEMLTLPGHGSADETPQRWIFEVTEWNLHRALVSSLFLIVDTQMPLSVFGKSVPSDELILLSVDG
jgi:hypothetical protein